MTCSILLGIAWFATLFLLTVVVQELADIRATLETFIKTYQETFVELSVQSEVLDGESQEKVDESQKGDK